MATSEWISLIALIISSGGFALQARGWLMSGPRLHLSVMGDAISFPHDDNKPKLALTVINRGDAPTVITHMIAYVYKSIWHRLRHRSEYAGVINSPNIPAPLALNQNWVGLMLYDRRTTEGRARGRLYVGIIASHANREFLIRVAPKREMKLPTGTIASE
jgi:hypothetical protein